MLTEEAREKFELWKGHFTQWNGRSLIAHNSSLTIETDASKKGGERDCDLISCPIGEVINFLAHFFEQCYQYRSINLYHSAISSMHEKVDSYEVGQHPMVSRILKGIFHKRPPQPRYSETWNMSKVTAYIEARGENDSLSLADLSLRFRRYLPEGVTFQPTKLVKQSRQSRPLAEFFFQPSTCCVP